MKNPDRPPRLAHAMAALVLSLAACATPGGGSGSGQIGSDGGSVAFSWKSDGGTGGTMSATLDDGTRFDGPFVQITSQARAEFLDPMWPGWRHGWDDWPYGSGPSTAFVTRYSGKVVANLRGSEGRYMRCRFHLNAPASGMAAGGQGECQLSDGRQVDAVFPPA
jgi:hypothetical protein